MFVRRRERVLAHNAWPVDLEERLRSWQTRGLLSPELCEQLLRDVSPADRALSSIRTVDTVFVLLSGLLNGVVVLSFAWLYDLDVPAHLLMLLWMASLVPLAYALRLPALGVLFGLQILAWAPLFTFRSLGFHHFLLRLLTAPVLLLLTGVALFALGALHYTWPPFHALARAIRLTALYACVVALFALGSPWVASHAGAIVGLDAPSALAQYAAAILGLGIAATLLTIVAIALKPFTPRTTRLEGPISLGLITVGAVHYAVPLPAIMFSVLFTGLMLAMLLVMLGVGIQRSDRATLNLATLGLWGLAMLRFFDFGWEPLGPVAFLAAGLILAGALGFALAAVRGRALAKLG
jgi:hypothetical protein